MPNVLAKAMYLQASNYYSIDMACTNKARYDVSGASWTYAQLYEAFPFDNVIYIVKIRGTKNIKEACHSANFCYHDASLETMNSSQWYTIAIIDYLLWHTDSNRNYDYFSFDPNYMEIIGTLKNSSGDDFLYRDICANYLFGIHETINASDYSTSVAEFIKPSCN